jgi:aspartate/methionine/tyrosine aminotransferase
MTNNILFWSIYRYNGSLKISMRTSGVEYAIRDIMLRAREYEKKGNELIYLNIGDPVKFGFKTPDHIKNALIEAVMNDRCT